MLRPDQKYITMRTSKWLASSVILFILLRVFVRSASLPPQGAENDTKEKALSRTKRFSMNEYLMIAISVFNIFVLLYNNIETFLPARSSPPVSVESVPSDSVNLNQAPQENLLVGSSVAAPAVQARADRDQTIDQIAEMLIR